MPTYQSYLNSYNGYMNSYNRNFKNPYSYSLGSPSSSVVGNFVNDLLWKPEPRITEQNRSLLNRVVDVLSTPNYAIAGMVDGAIRPDLTVGQGFVNGLKAGNPFGNGYVKGETTFSDVLNSAGWHPTSTAGKIARGAAGFVLDVALDPTTYLTGGTSALLKGSGKVGKVVDSLGKLTEDVGKATRYNTKIADLTSRGVSFDLAKRVAERGLNNPFDFSTSLDKLTPDTAEQLVRFQNTRRGINMSDAEIKDSAQHLSDKYNKLVGLRDNGKVTFGIGNIPFAPKSWRDKVWTLASDAPLRSLSDVTGLSKAYAGLRNFIYGSQIGKLFSTTSPLYKMASEDPAKLWETLQFTDITNGMKLDMIQKEKMIRDRFKAFNLTPSEQKDVLNLLQDKTIWKPIKDRLNFGDTALANHVRSLLENRKAKSEIAVADLNNTKKSIDTLQSMVNDKTAFHPKDLEQLKSVYREQLAKFDASGLTKSSEYKGLIDELTKQINELDAKYSTHGDVQSLNKLYDNAKAQREANTQFHERLNMLHDLKAKNSRGEINNLIDKQIGSTKANETWVKMGANDFANPEDIAHALRQANSKAIDNEILKMRSHAPGRSETLSLQDALSNYVYGESGKLVKLRHSNIDELMRLVNDGMKPEDIRQYIKDHSERFAPHMSDVWNYIADTLNYKEWNKDGYKYPLGKMLGLTEPEIDKLDNKALERMASEFYQSGDMKPAQYRLFTQLIQKKMARLEMISRFSQMSPEAFTRFRTEIANEKLINDFYKTKDKHLSLERNTFNNNDFAGDSRIDTSSLDNLYGLNDKGHLDVVRYEKKTPSEGFLGLTSQDRIDVWNDMVKFDVLPHDLLSYFGSDKQFNPLTKFMTKFMGHLEDALKHTFNLDYGEMSIGQKKLALHTAMQLTASNADRFDEKLAKAMHQKALQVLQDEKVNAIRQETTIGSRIAFKKDGETWSGYVIKTGRNADDMTEYSVQIPTSGEIIDGIKPQDVIRVKNDKQSMTPEQILMRSDIAKEDLASKKMLEDELKHVQDQFTTYKSAFKANRDSLKQFYETRISHYMSELQNLEAKQQDYEKALSDFNPEHLQTLTEQIARDENRINNTDALEQYVRLHPETFGNLDAYLKSQQPVDAGRIWLDELAPNDKVNQTVRELRHLFDTIGKEEIKIGRLSKEQFQGMLNQYVPHVLTPDGQDYFAQMRELTDHGANVTHDLGYGIKYNPYSNHRTIKGKDIEQINEHFRTELKGKNLFSENIADIYLARALKHNELMYDDKFMRTMLNIFGKDIPSNGKLEKGYKAVMNYGMLRKTVDDIASMDVSTHISNALRNFIVQNSEDLQKFAVSSNQSFDTVLSAHIDQFLKENFNDQTVTDLFKRFKKEAISDSNLPSGVFDTDGFPLMELSPKQIAGLNLRFNATKSSHLKSLYSSLNGAQIRGDAQRIDELSARIDKVHSNMQPPQIKQVNEVIVSRANMARELQRAKDQSRFLQMYDKFLHFMKLNQTTVMPSFHVRNKSSNMFLSWLGVGRDAFNKDYQLATTMLARHKGDISKIQELSSRSKFWEDKFRPIDIPNPHPSLVDAVHLNNGQLHWTDLYDLAKAHNVIDEGFFAQDIGASAMMKGKFKKLRYVTKSGKRINLDPTDTENFVLYRKGMEIGTTIENSDRLLHFMSLLKQGHSIRDAAESSRKFLFDYSDLTAFEQNVMKRIFPYYTWLRKNARLQVSQLIEQPNKYLVVAKIMNGVNHSNDRKDRLTGLGTIAPFAQDWLQLPFTHTNKFGSKEPLIMNPNMPFMDFNRIPDPTRLSDSLLNMLSQTAPQLKVPAELATNRSFFFNEPLIKKGDNKALAISKYLANQLALGNTATGLGTHQGLDEGLQVLNAMTGVKLLSFDYEYFKQMKANHPHDTNFIDTFMNKMGNGALLVLNNAESMGKDAIRSGAVKLVGQPPKDASDYGGALRPISKSTYDKLSDAEKKKYTAPTADEAFAYSKRAKELEKQAYDKAGAVKRFIWTLLDKTNISPKEDFTVGHVVKVTDGDTFSVKVGDSSPKSVRMLLIDTPETVHPSKPVMPVGHEASNYSKAMLFGKDVKLVFDGKKEDKYGRILAYVEIDGTDYNKSLVSKGLAMTRYTYKDFPNNTDQFSRTRDYFNAEQQAYNNHLGIWKYNGYATPGVDKEYNLRAHSIQKLLRKLNNK